MAAVAAAHTTSDSTPAVAAAALALAAAALATVAVAAASPAQPTAAQPAVAEPTDLATATIPLTTASETPGRVREARPLLRGCRAQGPERRSRGALLLRRPARSEFD